MMQNYICNGVFSEGRLASMSKLYQFCHSTFSTKRGQQDFQMKWSLVGVRREYERKRDGDLKYNSEGFLRGLRERCGPEKIIFGDNSYHTSPVRRNPRNEIFLFIERLECNEEEMKPKSIVLY
ncbi:unnamed protein product [Leptidea sinapis]|uniref:Uncharacterized protein n=1 Tax=Leptidea sinapis TaxID=189913 RepID=A0A5E4PTX9_9NEOP|nr:unnamed protein product [Leptidea sinapis]